MKGRRCLRAGAFVLLGGIIAVFMVLSPLGGGGLNAYAEGTESGWEIQDSGTSAILTGVSAVDAQDVWVVGDGVVLHTTDGGKTWNKVYEDPSTHFTDVCAVDHDNVWFAGRHGDPGTGINFISKTTDGGATWTVQLTVGEPYGINSISAATAQVAWAVGAQGMILKTADGGATWVSQVSGTPKTLTSVCAVDANVAWAVGRSEEWYPPGPYLPTPPPFEGAPYYPIILRTQDGGATWQVVQTGTYNEHFEDIAAVDALHAIATGFDILYIPMPILWKDPITGTSYIPLIQLDFTTAVAIHYGVVVWLNTKSVFGVDMVDANTAWMISSVSSKYIIYKTNDGGYTLVEQILPEVFISLRDIDAVDALNAWAVGEKGLILHTSNGGDFLPDLVSVTPDSGMPGTTVTLRGCDFGSEQGASFVSFGNVQATEYLSWSDREIKVKVPEGLVGTVQVTVTTSQGTSNALYFTSSPCGTGSAAALLALGISLGMLSLAGAAERRRKARGR